MTIGNPDALKRSVARNDYSTDPSTRGSNIIQYMNVGVNQAISDLPAYPSILRDRMLYMTPFREAMWGAAVHIAITKLATMDWRLDGRRIRQWQEILLSADNNQGFISFQQKQAKDYLLTNNGCFLEVIHATQGGGSRILGIGHLPSWRCWRTNDPDIPVRFYDRKGIIHDLKAHQVIMMSDEPNYDLWDIGICSADRAYPAIMKLGALETYIYEKISGKKAHRLYFVNAQIDETQIQDAIATQTEVSNQKGYVVYQDAVIIPILDPTAAASVAHIDLAGLPEGFTVDEERMAAQLVYADCLGLDPTDLDPNLAARGRALGSGSQAQVLDDKANGKGAILYQKQRDQMYDRMLFPGSVTFSTYGIDLADLQRKAQIRKTDAEAMRILVGTAGASPILTPQQAANVLVDLGNLSPEYIPKDLTPDETLRSTEKPDLALADNYIAPPDAGLMLTEPPKPAAPKPMTSKEYDELVNLAEKEVYEVIGEDVENYTERELVDWYQRTHPVKREIATIPVAPVIQIETKEAAPSQPQLIVVQPNIQPQHIDIHIPQSKEVAPNYTFNTPPSQFTIQMPSQPAPVVTVAPPTVNVTNEVQTPNVTVNNDIPVPSVTVAAADVTVNVPEAQPPTVTVNNQIDQQPETLDVIRNSEGFIERIVKTFGGK